MANTLNDLYLKYVNKVAPTLEKDRYFQYLYAMTEAGQTVLQQKNKVLHKVVDEEWLKMIEDSLDSLNEVTANPRRFVATSEEVVPVALAKKITADSVRHLSQNTQFISASEDGEIHPSRVLNVTTEDSYDLYENRFVYHLIQRLVAFIDKRTDLIFWSSGDETMNTLEMESTVDDAYETIEYKLELRIKNRQNLMENDSENMEVFKRIDRVRRLVMALRSSAFCSLMSGCAKVRSPIQRTNLIMKDPDYRNCYRLWQFLENYDSQGYTIEELDRALEFDEEYLIQLRSNLIANYAVFKSILEADARDITAPAKRRRVLRPKFLKKIEEQIVDDYDIEDVEIRQVIIEEVTQAQLDAEARCAEETVRAEEAEQRLELLERQATELQRLAADAQEQCGAAVAAAAHAESVREEAEAQLARSVRESQEKIAAAEKSRLAAEKRAESELDARRDMEVSLREMRTAKEQAEAARKAAEAERGLAEKQMLADRITREKAQANELRAIRGRKKAEEQIEKSAARAREYQSAAAASKAARMEAEKRTRQSEKTAAAAEAARTAAQERQQQAEQMAKQQEAAARSAEKAKAAAERRMLSAQERTEKAKAAQKEAQRSAQTALRAQEKAEKASAAAQQSKEEALQKAEEKYRTAQERHEKALRSARGALERETKAHERAETELAALRQALEEEKAARLAAEQRAEENSLGKRILSALGGRRN